MRLETLFLLFQGSEQAGSRGLMIFMFQMVAIVAIIYFLIFRPKIQQDKRHRERLTKIKRGDEIVTVGGIIAEVVHIKDDKLTVKSGESRLIIQRDRVADVHTKETARS